MRKKNAETRENKEVIDVATIYNQGGKKKKYATLRVVSDAGCNFSNRLRVDLNRRVCALIGLP